MPPSFLCFAEFTKILISERFSILPVHSLGRYLPPWGDNLARRFFSGVNPFPTYVGSASGPGRQGGEVVWTLPRRHSQPRVLKGPASKGGGGLERRGGGHRACDAAVDIAVGRRGALRRCAQTRLSRLCSQVDPPIKRHRWGYTTSQASTAPTALPGGAVHHGRL